MDLAAALKAQSFASMCSTKMDLCDVLKLKREHRKIELFAGSSAQQKVQFQKLMESAGLYLGEGYTLV